MSLLHTITHHLINIPGWHTKRKIVVIESDDWGSIRMPSKDVYKKLLKSGIDVDKCCFCKYDSLAGKDDMMFLFELLSKFKDKNNNPAVITANALVANPDFEKIRKSNFENYHYDLLPKTLIKKTNNNIKLWHEGINSNVFYPQFHGREHLNVKRWLRYLRRGSKELLLAFENEMFGISTTISKENNPSFMAALAVDENDDYEFHKDTLIDGYKIFENIFKYSSKSFIAPNYIWQEKHERVLADLGVKYLQGSYIQNEPLPKQKNTNKKYHFMGQKNKFDQTYLIRNCTFEPSSDTNKDWIDCCLKDINTAFKHNKPAVICTHRVNFIGVIDSKNRDKNLKLTEKLFKEILKKWPNVEFMSSDKLGELIIKEQVQ